MLSLISVEVNANVERFENTMWRAAQIADASMGAAAANADQFQTAFDQAALAVGRSSDIMAGNFESANDRVMAASNQAVQSVGEISTAVDRVDMSTWQEKMTTAFGAGVGAGVVVAQTWIEKVEEFAKSKLILIGVAIAAGVTVAAATAVYTAYKIISSSLGFIAGLFNGDSYKSQNIDTVIELNKEVKVLQDGLRISAVQASALNEALKGAGVDKSSYVSTMEAATKAARTNTDELDRLGVKYKDANGALLSQQDILQNVKKTLDEYTDGYDRNAAATAIGVGSYKEISDALSITSEKVATARERLIDYNLIIGQGSQEATSNYENAMKAFNREMDLTSTAIKKAISDQIMPVLTDLANLLKDGWPKTISVFRYSMALVTTTFYEFKEGLYVIGKVFIETLGMMAVGIAGISMATAMLLTGDVSGAAHAIASAWEEAKSRVLKAGDDMVAQNEKNVKAIRLAWGKDSMDAANGNQAEEKARKGKDWVPAPDKPKKTAEQTDPNGYEAFVQRLQRENTALEQNEYVMLKVEAAQKAYKDNVAATSALLAIDERQRLASAKAVNDFQSVMDKENVVLMNKRGAIGLVGIELDLYNMREQKRLEAISKVNEALRSGKPLTEEAADAIMKQADASAAAAESILRENAALERSFEVGSKKAFTTYLDNASNAAKNANDLFSNAFRSMEDALVKFTQTGKVDFRGLADSIISDLIRIQARAAMANAMSQASGSGGILGFISGLFGGSSAAGSGGAQTASEAAVGADINSAGLAGFAVGTDYVPEDMIAMIHKGERITPAAFNPTVGDKGVPVMSSGPSMENLRIEIVNTGSQQQEVQSGKAEFDAEGLVVKIITKDIQTDGRIANTLQARYGLNRAAGAYNR